jgi:hypothetical protein
MRRGKRNDEQNWHFEINIICVILFVFDMSIHVYLEHR